MASNAAWTAGVFTESFPEPLASSGTEMGLKFDLFMPWTINPDGTELLTLNHVGRHEISPGFVRSRQDSNLTDAIPHMGTALPAPTRAGALMQLSEHSTLRGRYYGVDAVTNGLSAGRIVSIISGAPMVNAASLQLRAVFTRGLARDPAVLSSGKLIASYATTVLPIDLANAPYASSGSIPVGPPAVDPALTLPPGSNFQIRVSVQPAAATLSPIVTGGSVMVNEETRNITNHTSSGLTQTFIGPLWQLQPVEVRPTTRPPLLVSKMEAPEREMFISAGVSPLALKSWMRTNDLAMMTVRNVTQRDGADHQQPTNLSVENGVSGVMADGGPAYSVKALQVFQGEYLRGYTSAGGSVGTGRRIKATAMRSRPGMPPTPVGLPESSAAVAADGSVAALVPAGRATSWQLVQHNGTPVVRERYWLSFQAGEIRSCTSCHAVNTRDQLGRTAAANAPAALRSLLETVKQSAPEISAGTFRIWSEASLGLPLLAQGDDDADGTANIIEWALGSSPVNASETPASPLTVTLAGPANATVASLSFTKSTVQDHAKITVEGSADMARWRTIATLGAASVVQPGYTLTSVANPDGKSERVNIMSLTPVVESPDRYYRLRVSDQ